MAADVCRALGVATDHTNKVTSLVLDVDVQTLRRNHPPSDGVCYRHLFTGSVALMRVLSESGLYKLIMRSDKQEALVFQHWIASEVLPSIRKTGQYRLRTVSAPSQNNRPKGVDLFLDAVTLEIS